MLGNLTVLISAYVVMRAFEALVGVLPEGVLRRLFQAMVALAAFVLLLLAPIVAVDTLSSSLETPRQQQQLQDIWR